MFEQQLKPVWQHIIKSKVAPFLPVLKASTQQVIDGINQGDLPRWLAAYNALPEVTGAQIDHCKDAITVNGALSLVESEYLAEQLQALHPWRKGPFQLFDTFIDTEWRSDMKWSRLAPHLPDLSHKTVLDVGCGNGYYLLKMSQQKPELLLGIEPGLLQNVQFWAINKYVESEVGILPLKIAQMPASMRCFDVVLSMGVLYHRKSPIEHLEHLKSLMSQAGTLVLETLIVDGDEQTCLVPPGRYAQMRNVWFLPSVPMLVGWLKKIGFKNIEVVDVSVTTVDEQRSTAWMQFHSLPQFLAAGGQLTLEGHPPPKRAIITCQI